ncbi:MAG: coproporphyrinogen III oxidase, partial [Flavobacteriaceae bacterium]
LPPHVQWEYNHQPQENSKEEELLSVLRKPRPWA